MIQCLGSRGDPVCTSRRICLWWKGNGDDSSRARSYSNPNDRPVRNTQTCLLLLLLLPHRHRCCCFHFHWDPLFFPGSLNDSSPIRPREPLSSTQAMSSPWSEGGVVVWFFSSSPPSQCVYGEGVRFCFLALNYGWLIPILLYYTIIHWHPLRISHVS